MAMVAPEVTTGQLASTRQANARHNIPFVGTQPKDSKVTGKERSFRDTEFVKKESTGAEVGKRGEKRHGIEGRDVTFSAELTTQYEHFLYDHLEGLLRVTNPADLDNDAHRHELRLREALCTNNKPDKAKITAYLESSSDGWSITTQLLEDQTAKKLFASALLAATRPRGERVDQLDENTIRLHLNQGLLNRAMMDHVVPWLNEPVNVTSGRPEDRGYAGGRRILGRIDISDFRRWQSILTQMGGSLSMGGSAFVGTLIATGDVPWSIAAGVAAGAVVPGLMAIRNTLNSGVTIDLRQCSAALQSIQNDPAEAEYLRSVLNIDVTNFEVAGPNQIRLRDAHALSPNNMNQIQREIFQGLYAREQFYTSIGVPYEQLDALPEQHLYLYSRGQAEQTGTHWQQRLNEIFQPQTAGIMDTTGRSPNTAGFDSNALDFEGNLRRFRKARRQVMMEMMEERMTRVEDGTLATKAVTMIGEKESARGSTGTEMTARRKPMVDRKAALVKEKDRLTPEKTVFDEYTTAKTALETEQKKYETEFEIAFLAGRNIDAELTRVVDILTNRGNALSIPARRDAIMGALNPQLVLAYAQVDGDLTLQYGANPVPADVRTTMHNEVAQRTKALYQADLDALREEETELKTQRTRLRTIRESVTAAQRILNEKSDRTVASAKENLITVGADYTAVTTWGIGAVALQTMNVDEIMVQINAANAANVANGWPEAQNNDPVNRTRVINAIAEAKAAYEESFDTQKPVRDIEYGALTGWGITADQLRTMSRQQLLVLINDANAANAANGWPPGGNAIAANILRVNSAVEEARNRMILRHNAVLATRFADIDAQDKTQDRLMEAINFENEKDILGTIKDLMGRQPKVFEIAYDVASDRARFTDVTPVAATDVTFTTAEKAVFDGAIPPVGYWRIMNALFAYDTKADRSTYVGKMLKTLPPKKLARYINSSLGRAPADPDIEDIELALVGLEAGIGGGALTSIDVRGTFRNIINGLRAEANAL